MAVSWGWKKQERRESRQLYSVEESLGGSEDRERIG